VSRKAAWVLIALCAWTLYVWITRIFIMAGQDESAGFKIVHGVLAAISIAFGLAAGWIGLRRLRAGDRDSSAPVTPERKHEREPDVTSVK
jgi:hypothetical protein